MKMAPARYYYFMNDLVVAWATKIGLVDVYM